MLRKSSKGDSMNFKIKLADKIIGITCQYEYLKDYCSEYIVENSKNADLYESDFQIETEMKDILFEQQKASDETKNNYAYLETLAALRKIAEIMPKYHRFLMHGVVVSWKDTGYMFTAPSGTGKSTHAALWKKYLGDEVEIINGDKPILNICCSDGRETDDGKIGSKNQIAGDGKIGSGNCIAEDNTDGKPDCESQTASDLICQNNRVYAYGTPWAGKEHWQKNTAVPLNGICILQRGSTNHIRQMQLAEALPWLIRQVHFPQAPENAGRTLELIDQLLKIVPVYCLECDMSWEAVKCSFERLTGEKMPETKKVPGIVKFL